MGEKTDIRTRLKDMDDLALLDVSELGGILGMPTNNATYVALKRGLLPVPVIRRPRHIRWSVGQVKEYLRGLQASPLTRAPRADKGKRLGRPRLETVAPAEA